MTIHADRGASMASKPVAFREAQFKTLKYRPTFPGRFGRKPPIPPTLPTTAWINQPKEEPLDTANP